MGLFEDEGVMIDDILHDQVDGRHFQRIVSSPEMLNYVRVMAVKGTQEKQDKMKRKTDGLASHHLQNEAVKLGQKCHNGLIITLELVEDQEQGGKVLATESGNNRPSTRQAFQNRGCCKCCPCFGRGNGGFHP